MKKLDLNIVRATQADLDVLVEYNMALASETEDKTLERNVLREGIRMLFESEERGFYLVARIQGEENVIGQLLITYEWSDWRNHWIWWIQSVYIHKDYRGKGVYRKLHESVRTMARKSGEVIGLRLCVDRGNDAARAVYRKMAMTPSRYDLLEDLWIE